MVFAARTLRMNCFTVWKQVVSELAMPKSAGVMVCTRAHRGGPWTTDSVKAESGLR